MSRALIILLLATACAAPRAEKRACGPCACERSQDTFDKTTFK